MAGAEAAQMTALISHTTIDCADAYTLSEWWKQVLGYADVENDSNKPGDEECMIRDPATGQPAALHRGAGRRRGQAALR